MTKYLLLQLLGDAEVQKKILSITREGDTIFAAKPRAQSVIAADKQGVTYDEKSVTHDGEGVTHDGESVIHDGQAAPNYEHEQQLQKQLQEARNEIYQLRNSLAKAEQRTKNLQSELEEWKGAYETSKRHAGELQKINSQLERDKSNLQQNINDLRDESAQRSKTIQQLREELAERFERGWELFQRYQDVSAHSRQLLKVGVFPHDDFMSFICGGAQTNSLETLWDVLKECVLGGRQQDAEILWEIFEYCIELVNSSKSQASYSILTVNEGDRFDSDCHIEGPNSKAQGQVGRIYLPGYRNNYSRKIIKKSIVQVS